MGGIIMLQEVQLDIRGDLKALCKKAGIDPAQVYGLKVTPTTITFLRLMLDEDGKPFYDREADDVARMLPLTFGIK